MSFAKNLKCRECGRVYPLDPLHVCEFCFGPLEVFYDYEALARTLTRERIERGPLTMWRYADLLPCAAERVVDIGTGYTPLLRAAHLGRLLGSVAAHAARAGMDAFVFIPADLEQGKIVGSAVYNPTLMAVDGSYDEVNRLCSELSDKYPWAFVNINMRPYYAEGSKTLAYEVCEQLGWRAPDHCIVPLASGSLYTKIYKGLRELAWLGLVEWRGTRMSGAQALGCSPIVEAWERDSFNIKPQKPNTIAKSLAIGNPADGYYALKVMSQSGGHGVAVTDDELVEGIKILAETEGIFAETAGGVVIAGLRRLVEQGRVDRQELVVAFITGAGLKTQEAVASRLQPALAIQPSITSFEEVLSERAGALPATRK